MCFKNHFFFFFFKSIVHLGSECICYTQLIKLKTCNLLKARGFFPNSDNSAYQIHKEKIHDFA